MSHVPITNYVGIVRAGKYEEGFWELAMATELSDNLVYDEPWGWMQPPIHALGALTLEQVLYTVLYAY